MDMFENRVIRGEYASRYIASWMKVGGTLKLRKDRELFYSWLRFIGLDRNEANIIYDFACNGKLEFELSAMSYLK